MRYRVGADVGGTFTVDIGLVSKESAGRDYGAVLDEKTGKIDRAATEVHRAKLEAEWKRDQIFVDQWTRPFAREAFRVVGMDEKKF
jgi:hypothetical protein